MMGAHERAVATGALELAGTDRRPRRSRAARSSRRTWLASSRSTATLNAVVRLLDRRGAGRRRPADAAVADGDDARAAARRAVHGEGEHRRRRHADDPRRRRPSPTRSPPIDAPTVERMRAAGAIPFARTNLPDLGLRVHTDSSLHGLTRNPWNPNVTAGGSSGGEASALAAG